MPERMLEFDSYTDDSAPGYGWSLRTVYTTLIAVVLVAATVALVRYLENSAVGAAVSDLQGTGTTDLVVSTLYVPVMFVLFAVGRYAGVRGVDTGRLPRAVAGVLAMLVVYAIAAVGFLEIVATGVTDEFYLYLGGLLAGVVVVANVLVLAMDRDLSAWEAYAYGLVFVTLVYVIVMVYVWNQSADGLWWELFKLMRSALVWVLIPVILFPFYVHDAWRNAERGLGPTFNGLATYVAISSTVLFPLELLYAFTEEDDS